ncbi:MAG: hypothetical protein WA794_19810, partial [Trebonia sp.]
MPADAHPDQQRRRSRRQEGPFGTPGPTTATAATTTAAPPTNPWMHQPSYVPPLTAAYQAFPPITPAATAATDSSSGRS